MRTSPGSAAEEVAPLQRGSRWPGLWAGKARWAWGWLSRIGASERRSRSGEPTPGDAVASQNAKLPIGASQGYSWGFELQPDGDMTIVTEIFDCTEAAQSIRDAVHDGQSWVQAMQQTLERLAALVERT
jgi:hypothetical protein